MVAENDGTLIDNLHVAAEAKGKGIGKEMIRLVAAQSLEISPDDKIYLWVLKDNEKAFQFYVHFGARHLETRLGDEIGDRKVYICRMVWDNHELLSTGQ